MRCASDKSGSKLKVKFKYNRRYSMIITLSACAASLWLMINNFHFPAEEVLRIAAVCFVLIVPLLVIAAAIGFVMRKMSDRNLSQIMEQNQRDMDKAANVDQTSVQSDATMEMETHQANTDAATIKNSEEMNRS
ncbi:hypothetical protein TDB9533_01150 [Thalassocella blandensis]|nr:hypothetical protein TDB9533_01150 [Thalassocella blandensis]